MLTQKHILTAVLGMSLVATAPSVLAFGLSSLTHTSSSTQSGSAADAGPAQAALLAKFLVGEKAILIAQSHLAAAYGFKSQAEKLAVEAKAMKSGATNAQVQDALADSKKANKQIAGQIAKGAKLAAAGRKDYVKSLPYYGIGVVDLKDLIPASQNFMTTAKQQISAAPFTQMASIKRKLATGMFIATNTPGYLKGIVKTSVKLVTYAKANHIAVPKSATDALGS